MAGVSDGVYEMLGQKITVKNGICRTEAGGLAGSSLTMNVAVRNMVNVVGLSLQEAIMMAYYKAVSRGLNPDVPEKLSHVVRL